MDFPVQFAQSEESYVATMEESDQRFEAEFTEEESWDIQFEEEDEGFQLGFEESTDSFSVGFEEGIFTGGGLPLYTGAYEVTPKIEAQKLDTANRSMEKDVTIHAIPYYEVDNASNGQTIVIGGN